MENILYITGGVALLALAWLLVSLTRTLKVVRTVMVDAIVEVRGVTRDISEMKAEALPIMQNLHQISIRANVVAERVQSQMVSIQDTVDDTLDVFRGTIDDVERLKNEVVDIVEGPLRAARNTTSGTVGIIAKGIGLLVNLFGDRRNGHRKNGKRD